MLALNSRVHMFAHPSSREKMADFFSTVLGCEVLVIPDASVVSKPSGLPTPVLVCRFTNGSSLSVEFTEDALDEKQARRGAYLELKTDTPLELQKRILEAGLPKLEYANSEYFYFQAPNGQVLRIAPFNEI
jgi:hypothetical protein